MIKDRIKNYIAAKLKIKDKIAEAVPLEMQKHGFVPISESMDDDVFIVGFPKSGNTWLSNLVAGMVLESSSERFGLNLVNEIVSDVHAKKFYKRMGNRVFFRSHSLPQQKYRNVIYIVRDGRDVMVSYYHYLRKLKPNERIDLDGMIRRDLYVSPSNWGMHLNRWLSNPYGARMVIVKYENLLTDTLAELRKLSDFLSYEMEDEKLKEISEMNSIENIRNKVRVHGWEYDKAYSNSDSLSFFRKGVIGNYKNEMSEEQISFFEKRFENELKRMDYL